MKKLFYILTATLLFGSCAVDNTDDGIVSQGLLTIPNVPDQWTYVSLTKGRVVGTCSLTDTVAQHQWATRTDWDLATCNGMIRTNGGDSGSGQGAAAVSGQGYEETDAAQPAPYVTDRDSVGVW